MQKMIICDLHLFNFIKFIDQIKIIVYYFLCAEFRMHQKMDSSVSLVLIYKLISVGILTLISIFIHLIYFYLHLFLFCFHSPNIINKP